MRKRTVYAWGAAVACFILLMILTPSIPQPQEYHDFADKRKFFGLMLCHHRNYFKLSLQGELWGWICFYVGVAAVAFESSYYHLKPDHARLVWDRLPMTVTFPSMMAILIIERIDEKQGMVSIVPLLMASIMSIVYWRFFDDIRLYVLVQFVSCIAIPLMAILLPPTYTHSTYWLWAAGFYPLALLQDATDKVIYEWTHHIVSGHTLKHLSAAMVPVVLTIMLAKRSVNLGRLLHVYNTQILQIIEFTVLRI